jgi:hypothetical protein
MEKRCLLFKNHEALQKSFVMVAPGIKEETS